MSATTTETGYTVVTIRFEDNEMLESTSQPMTLKAATKAFQKFRGTARLLDPTGVVRRRKAA
jgi:hypothetical protein